MSEASDFYIEQAARAYLSTAEEQARPFYLLRPRVFPDGNQWCALYGENLQEGICGFGDTPSLASYDFDKTFFNQRLDGATK